jgi:hypothetical protein
MRNESGLIHNTSEIVVKCGRGHPHRYFVNDVVTSGLSKCHTCDGGTKFTTVVRESFEVLTGEPCVIDTTLPKGVVQFYNPRLRVRICCDKKPGDNTAQAVDGTLFITQRYTSSIAKIRNHLRASLLGWDGIGDELRAKLTQRSMHRASAAEDGVPRTLPRPPAFPKAPLVFSPELAAATARMTVGGDGAGGAGDATNTTVETNAMLYFENC